MRASRLDPVPEARLRDAILSLQPTAYWPLDDGSGPLRSLSGNWPATVTGSPTYGVAANPIGRGITFSGTSQYAATSAAIPVPTASMSVLAFYRTTNSTATNRYFMARRAASQQSWQFELDGSHGVSFEPLQLGGTAHCVATVAGATNDGEWHLALGTFDGTTVIAMRDAATRATSTTLTGSWKKDSTDAIGLASSAAGALTNFPGTLAHLAYWADRVVTDAERRWLHSIAKGA